MIEPVALSIHDWLHVDDLIQEHFHACAAGPFAALPGRG